jgi:hypothetical protein|tara:strand:+ start:134 stop:511 length:378 start_codon:yes stop_codon:yes gene_type:complete
MQSHDDRIKEAFEKANKLEEVFDFIKENKINHPRNDCWVHFADKIGFNEECKKFGAQDELYKTDFWDKCRPLVLSSSDEPDEKKHQNFINLIKYFYDKSSEQRRTINWLVLRNPKSEDYWIKKSK